MYVSHLVGRTIDMAQHRSELIAMNLITWLIWLLQYQASFVCVRRNVESVSLKTVDDDRGDLRERESKTLHWTKLAAVYGCCRRGELARVHAATMLT